MKVEELAIVFHEKTPQGVFLRSKPFD